MADSRIFNKTYTTIANALDISARRHSLITGNIANIDTIGYKPRDLDFKKTLDNAMSREKPRSMSGTHADHFQDEASDPDAMTGSLSQDSDLYHLDSVNIDTEMTNLVENNIKYRTATEMLLRKMSILKHTIQEGGR